MAELRDRHDDLVRRTSELRASLGTLQKTRGASPLRQKLLDRLGKATEQVDELSRTLVDRGAKAAELRATLEDSIRDLELTAPAATAGPLPVPAPF